MISTLILLVSSVNFDLFKFTLLSISPLPVVFFTKFEGITEHISFFLMTAEFINLLYIDCVFSILRQHFLTIAMQPTLLLVHIYNQKANILEWMYSLDEIKLLNVEFITTLISVTYLYF
ncbi:hypothetical protein ACJX0J_026152, partial [Zea mays]